MLIEKSFIEKIDVVTQNSCGFPSLRYLVFCIFNSHPQWHFGEKSGTNFQSFREFKKEKKNIQ